MGQADSINDIVTSFTYNSNNQILYGRRGTGKTHVLKVLKAEMEKEGYKPADIYDLLAYDSKENWLVALGSVWRNSYDNRHVPVLDVDGSDRKLDLNYFGSDWDARCRFLGVRK